MLEVLGSSQLPESCGNWRFKRLWEEKLHKSSDNFFLGQNPTSSPHLCHSPTKACSNSRQQQQKKEEKIASSLPSTFHRPPSPKDFYFHAPQRHELHPQSDFPPRLHAGLLGEGPEALDSLAPGNKWVDSVDSHYFMGAVVTQILKSWITYSDFHEKVS